MAKITWEHNGLVIGAEDDKIIVGDSKFDIRELDDLLENIDVGKEYVEGYLEDQREAAQEGGE